MLWARTENTEKQKKIIPPSSARFKFKLKQRKEEKKTIEQSIRMKKKKEWKKEKKSKKMFRTEHEPSHWHTQSVIFEWVHTKKAV